jgi:hypothetical protein
MKSQTFAPSEIVAALVYFVDRQFLSADSHRLQSALRVARDVCPLLQQFSFSQTGVHPISRSFDDALSLLKLTRVLRMENTDYERYIIDPEAKAYIRSEILPKFSAADQSSLEAAAAVVREQCGATNALVAA